MLMRALASGRSWGLAGGRLEVFTAKLRSFPHRSRQAQCVPLGGLSSLCEQHGLLTGWDGSHELLLPRIRYPTPICKEWPVVGIKRGVYRHRGRETVSLSFV